MILTESATLRVFSRNRTVDELSSLLGREPTHSVRKGDPYSRRSASSRLREESGWFLESGLSDKAPLGRHIEQILGFAEVQHQAFRDVLHDAHADLWCTCTMYREQGGIELEPELLLRIANAGLPLIFSIIAAGEEQSG